VATEGASTEYFYDLDRHAPPDRDEELRLALAARDESLPPQERAQARDELARRNIRLVAYVAKRYRRLGDYDDILADGNLGLMRAVDAYDPAEGVPFASYAPYWIKAAIRVGLARAAYPVCVPPNFLGKYLVARPSASALEARMGRRATPEEMAALSGLSAVQSAGIAAALARRSDGGPEAACESSDPAALAADREERELARRVVELLPPRLERVLRGRLGIDGPRSTLREIGRDMRLSRERIRHLEQQGVVMARALASGATYEEAWMAAMPGTVPVPAAELRAATAAAGDGDGAAAVAATGGEGS
jgi:RNA polymerase primary sigma factor